MPPAVQPATLSELASMVRTRGDDLNDLSSDLRGRGLEHAADLAAQARDLAYAAFMHVNPASRPLTQDECDALGLDGRDGTGTYTVADLHLDLLKRWPDLADTDGDPVWSEITWMVSMGIPYDMALRIIADPRYRWRGQKRSS